MKFGLLVLVVICTTSVTAQDFTLPKSVKSCKKDSKDYSSCLRLAIQEAWPVFTQGIPELSLPALDPYSTDFAEHNFEYGEVTGKVIVRNGKTYGLNKAKFLSVRPTHKGDSYRLEIDLEIPKILIEGDFKSNGKIGGFEMSAKGQFNVSMEDVRAMMILDGPVVNDKWMIEEFSYSPEPRTMKIWASDLFNGNKALTEVMLAFANEYWQVLYQSMMPYASKVWNGELKDLVNKIFSKLSFVKTFP